MSSKTKAQLAAENLALHARLTQLEDELAKRRPGRIVLRLTRLRPNASR